MMLFLHSRSLDSILPLPGIGFRDACCRSPPGVEACLLVPALVHSGVVTLPPRPTGGGTTAKLVAAIADCRPSPCRTPFNSCNSPFTRADPFVIHAGVVVRLPCPTGGRAATGRIVTIAGALSPPTVPTSTDAAVDPLAHGLFRPSSWSSISG